MTKPFKPQQDYSTRVYSWQLEQVPTENPIHDELLYAFQQYYIANLHWKQCGTKRSALDARYWLNVINQLTVKQRRIINDWKKTISDKTNPERSYKPTIKKRNTYVKLQGMIDDPDTSDTSNNSPI